MSKIKKDSSGHKTLEGKTPEPSTKKNSADKKTKKSETSKKGNK